jgi:hypothetical protein
MHIICSGTRSQDATDTLVLQLVLLVAALGKSSSERCREVQITATMVANGGYHSLSSR